MKIKFIGTGGAFDFAKGTASAVVEVGGQTILIDCGFSTLPRLAQHDIIRDIDYILITHLHGDHVGSLPTLLPYFKYRLNQKLPQILVPNQAFQQELHAFLRATYEDDRASYVKISEMPHVDYFETTDTHVPGMASYAYYFTENDTAIYFSGDTGSLEPVKTFLQERTESNITIFHETTFQSESMVHVPYTTLQNELTGYDVYAYHIDKANKPADCTLKLVEEYPEFML